MVTSDISPSHHRKAKTLMLDQIVFSLTAAVRSIWPHQWLLLRHIAYPLTR